MAERGFDSVRHAGGRCPRPALRGNDDTSNLSERAFEAQLLADLPYLGLSRAAALEQLAAMPVPVRPHPSSAGGAAGKAHRPAEIETLGRHQAARGRCDALLHVGAASFPASPSCGEPTVAQQHSHQATSGPPGSLPECSRSTLRSAATSEPPGSLPECSRSTLRSAATSEPPGSLPERSRSTLRSAAFLRQFIRPSIHPPEPTPGCAAPGRSGEGATEHPLLSSADAAVRDLFFLKGQPLAVDCVRMGQGCSRHASAGAPGEDLFFLSPPSEPAPSTETRLPPTGVSSGGAQPREPRSTDPSSPQSQPEKVPSKRPVGSPRLARLPARTTSPRLLQEWARNSGTALIASKRSPQAARSPGDVRLFFFSPQHPRQKAPEPRKTPARTTSPRQLQERAWNSGTALCASRRSPQAARSPGNVHLFCFSPQQPRQKAPEPGKTPRGSKSPARTTSPRQLQEQAWNSGTALCASTRSPRARSPGDVRLFFFSPQHPRQKAPEPGKTSRPSRSSADHLPFPSPHRQLQQKAAEPATPLALKTAAGVRLFRSPHRTPDAAPATGRSCPRFSLDASGDDPFFLSPQETDFSPSADQNAPVQGRPQGGESRGTPSRAFKEPLVGQPRPEAEACSAGGTLPALERLLLRKMAEREASLRRAKKMDSLDAFGFDHSRGEEPLAQREPLDTFQQCVRIPRASNPSCLLPRQQLPGAEPLLLDSSFPQPSSHCAVAAPLQRLPDAEDLPAHASHPRDDDDHARSRHACCPRASPPPCWHPHQPCLGGAAQSPRATSACDGNENPGRTHQHSCPRAASSSHSHVPRQTSLPSEPPGTTPTCGHEEPSSTQLSCPQASSSSPSCRQRLVADAGVPCGGTSSPRDADASSQAYEQNSCLRPSPSCDQLPRQVSPACRLPNTGEAAEDSCQQKHRSTSRANPRTSLPSCRDHLSVTCPPAPTQTRESGGDSSFVQRGSPRAASSPSCVHRSAHAASPSTADSVADVGAGRGQRTCLGRSASSEPPLCPPHTAARSCESRASCGTARGASECCAAAAAESIASGPPQTRHEPADRRRRESTAPLFLAPESPVGSNSQLECRTIPSCESRSSNQKPESQRGGVERSECQAMPVFTTSQGCDSRSDRRSESRASDSQLRAGIDLSDVHQKFPDATHCHRCEPRSSNWRSASREATPADMLSSPRLHPGASLPRSTQPASGASAALPLRSESREVHTEESHGADCHCETGQQRHIISTASSRRPEVCEATLAVRLSTSRVHTATSAIECEPSTRSNHGPTQCRGCGSRETGRKREDSPAGNASEIRRQKDAAVRDSCRACDMGRSVYSMATADSFIDARSHAATERATLPQYSTCTSHGCTLHTAYADSIAEPRLPSEVDTSMPTASVANSHKNTSPRRRCRCSAESLRSFAEQCQCSQSGASRCEASSHGTAPFAGFAGVLGPSCRAAGCSIPTVDSFSGSLGDAAPSHTGRASGNMMQSDSFVDVRSQTDQCPTTSCTGRGSMVDTNSLTNVQSHTGCEPLQHWGCTHKKVQASDRFHPEQCHGGVQYRSCCTGYRNVGSLASETHHPNAWQHQANAATVEQVQSAGNIPEARTLRVGCTCAAHDDTQGPQFPSRRACSCCCSATGNTTCHGSVLQLHQSSSEVPALATSRNYIIDSSEPCTGQRIAVHNGTSSTGSTSIHCQTHTMQAHPCGTCISSSQCQTHDTWGHGPPIAFLSNASAQHTDLNVAPWGLGPSNARSNGSVSPVSYECTQRIQKADISIIQRDQHPPHASVHHGQRADINTIPWRQIPSITPASFDESAHRIHETDVSIMPWGQSPANARISNGFVAPVSNESAQHIQKIDVSMIMPGGQSPSIAPVSFDDPAHPAHKNADASTPLARSPSEDDLSGDYLSPTEQRRGEFDRAEQPGPRLRLLSTIEVNDALGSLLPIGSQHPPQQSSNHRQMQTWEHADSACRFQQNPQTRRQVYLQDLQPGSQHELPGNASVLCTQSVRQGPVSPHRGQRQALYYQQQDDTEGRTQRPQQQALLHGLPHPQLPPPQSHQQQQQGGGQDLHPGSAHLDQLLSRRQSHSQGSQHPPPAPAQQQSCRQQPANLLAQRQTQPQGLHAGFQQLQQAPSWHPAPVDSQNLFVDSARGVQLPQPRQSQTQGLHTGFQHPQQQTDSQESFTDSAREVQLPQSQRQAHPRGLHTGFQHPQQAPSHRQQRADSQESLTGPAREIQLPQPPRRQTHPQQAPFQQTQRGGYEPADIMREARSTASDACDRRERPRTIVGGDRPESASFDAPLRRREGAGEHTDGDPARAAAASGPVEAESWEAAMSRIRAIRKQSAKALKGWACDDGAGCGETTGGKREADDPKAAAALPQPKAHLGAPGDGVDVGKGALDDDSAGILRRVRERRSLCQTALQTLRSDLEETALAPKGDLNV